MEVTGPVRDGQAIDADRVAGWLGDRVAGARPLAISQFKGGQSNPTYLVTDEAGAPYVLRRKPPGVPPGTAQPIEGSKQRRVGKERGCPGRYRWSPCN